MYISYVDQRNYRNTARLVNLTKRAFCIYEQNTGNMIALPCKKVTIPKEPYVKSGECSTHYIVDAKEADELRASGRPLDDIAILKRVDSGRNGVPIASLVWGEDNNRRVILKIY